MLPGRTPNIRVSDLGIVKKYNDNSFKLVHLHSCRISGFEELNKDENVSENKHYDKKLLNSLSRSRKKVFEYAFCNDWDYFVTITIDPNLHDRYSLSDIYKKLAKWINNFNTRYELSIKYLIIPEQHKNGAWHFHCLFQNLPIEYLTSFNIYDYIPEKLKLMIASGRKIFYWNDLKESFGYNTLECIIDPDKCACYMTKYMTKELLLSSISLGFHVYYVSQGLKTANKIFVGHICKEIENPDFSNKYIHLKSFNNLDDALQYFDNGGIV